MMIVPPTLRKHTRRARRRAPAAPPPPVALTLVAAAFNESDAVTLTFGRAIDIGGIDVAAIVVDDPVYTGEQLQGDPDAGATLLGPAVVRVMLAVVGDPKGGGVTLTASGSSGIVAVGDRGTWAGAVNLALPYP